MGHCRRNCPAHRASQTGCAGGLAGGQGRSGAGLSAAQRDAGCAGHHHRRRPAQGGRDHHHLFRQRGRHLPAARGHTRPARFLAVRRLRRAQAPARHGPGLSPIAHQQSGLRPAFCFYPAMPEALRIVVIISDPPLAEGDAQAQAQAERSRLLRIGLLEAGYNLVATLPADPFLTERLAQLQADLVIVDAESDARDALEHVVMATRDERRPIVMFTSDEDTSHVHEAVAAGVTAYIVDGLAPERIRPILTVAIARFRHQEALLAELDNARGELQERKLIERAKGLLMQRQGLSEPEAYAKLRKAAMNKSVKLADIAQQMIDMAELLG